MIEVNRQGEVWVFCEQEDGKAAEIPFELLGKGRELADSLGVKLATVLLGGKGIDGIVAKLGSYGAERVYLVEHDVLERYQTDSYCEVFCDLVHEYEPQICLFGATPIGRSLAPTVASRMWCGLTADCTDLQIGDHIQAGSDEVHKNLLKQIRPAFGGSIIATIVNYERWPQMATVREGVMIMPEPDKRLKAEVVRPRVELDGFKPALEIIDSHREAKEVDLKSARIIVSGGAGVGSSDNFRLIWELAQVLGGAVGGSRAAVDLGFVAKGHQVGQTGTTVRPALYVAVGISGAIQHIAGMEESAKILAINNDGEAPIFGAAHYGIIGDMNEVIPKLIKAIRHGAQLDEVALSK